MQLVRRRRFLGQLAAVGGCGLLTAACGAGGGTGTGAGTTNNRAGYSTALKFANCMRAHGVPNFPDPGANGIPVGGPGGKSDLNPQAPAFHTAAKACHQLAPGLGGPPHPLSAAQKQRLLAFSQCMRTHGVPNFPDPTFPASGGAIIGSPQQLPFNPASPAVRRAFRTCGQPFK